MPCGRQFPAPGKLLLFRAWFVRFHSQFHFSSRLFHAMARICNSFPTRLQTGIANYCARRLNHINRSTSSSAQSPNPVNPSNCPLGLHILAVALLSLRRCQHLGLPHTLLNQAPHSSQHLRPRDNLLRQALHNHHVAPRLSHLGRLS